MAKLVKERKQIKNSPPQENLRCQLLPRQLTLINSHVPYIAYIGGAGSGKTMGGALKALRMCLEFPTIRGYVTAPTYKVLEGATLTTYEEVFTNRLIKAINKTDLFMELYNGSKIFFRTTTDPYLLRGATIGFFHMDEGAKSPALAFKMLQARLRQRVNGVLAPNQGWVTTTPAGFNWVFHEFAERERENYLVIRTNTADNFLLPPDYVGRLEESYTDELFYRQELMGEFVEIGGETPFDIHILGGMYQKAANFVDMEREMGWVYTFQPPVTGKTYIIAADAATGQGEDESAFIIGDVSVEKVSIVGCGKSKLSEADFGEALAIKGRQYNDATIIVEAAPVGKATLNKLEEEHYPFLYKTKNKAGWTAMRASKPMMVADLAELIAEEDIEIPSLDIIEQLMGYVRNDKGVYGAGKSARDDYVSALLLLVQAIKKVPVAQALKRIVVKSPSIRYSYQRT